MLGLPIAHTTYLCISRSYTTTLEAAILRLPEKEPSYELSSLLLLSQGPLARHESNGQSGVLSRLSESGELCFLGGSF